MSRQAILYLAYPDEQPEDGLSYALYLAGQMGEPLSIALLKRSGAGEKLERLLSAVTFAEAGEHETAREMLEPQRQGQNTALHNYLLERCAAEGIEATVHDSLEASAAAVAVWLRQRKIDLVLLSPAVSQDRRLRHQLMRLTSRPLVTMARGDDRPQP